MHGWNAGARRCSRSSIFRYRPWPLIRLSQAANWSKNYDYLSSPQAFHRFVIHLPACISQQGSDPAIAISTVLARQFDHVLDQALFVSTPLWQPTLRGSVLAQNATSPSLRNFELVAAHDQCRPAGGRGSEVSRCGLFQD